MSPSIKSSSLMEERNLSGKVAFKNLAIGILPIDEEGYTWLVGQYRYTLDEYSWEMPMGGVPHGENPEEGALENFVKRQD